MNKTIALVGWVAILIGNIIGWSQGDFATAYKWSLGGSGILGLGVIKDMWRK